MYIKNHMEDIVWQHLDDVIESHQHICSCDQCRHDIAALALNSLPPRYIVTEKGERFVRITELENQFMVDILAAISNAISIVNKQPHRDLVR